MHAQAGEQKLVTAFVQLQIMSIREYYLWYIPSTF
jgi:hypothetical protein